jgi:hypothetical protein
MAPSLEGLPPELLDIIADFCTDDGNDDDPLLKLRSTCRSIEGRMAFYFTERYLDLDAAKLDELKQIGAVSDLARATTAIVVCCKDDSKQFSPESSSSQALAELMNLSFMMALALRNFSNVDTIAFTCKLTRSGASKQRIEPGDPSVDFSIPSRSFF